MSITARTGLFLSFVAEKTVQSLPTMLNRRNHNLSLPSILLMVIITLLLISLYHLLLVCVLRVSHRHAQMISGSWDTRAVVFNLNDLIFGQPPKVALSTRLIYNVFSNSHSKATKIQFGTLSLSPSNRTNSWPHQLTKQSSCGPKAQQSWLSMVTMMSLGLWFPWTRPCLFRLVMILLFVYGISQLESASGLLNRMRVNSFTGWFQCRYVIVDFNFSMTQVRTPDGRQLIVTSGECGYVEFFGCDDEGKLTFGQVIRTPATSLWSIHSLPNGDLAVAAE